MCLRKGISSEAFTFCSIDFCQIFTFPNEEHTALLSPIETWICQHWSVEYQLLSKLYISVLFLQVFWWHFKNYLVLRLSKWPIVHVLQRHLEFHNHCCVQKCRQNSSHSGSTLIFNDAPKLYCGWILKFHPKRDHNFMHKSFWTITAFKVALRLPRLSFIRCIQHINDVA